jgi:hypothetical protein
MNELVERLHRANLYGEVVLDATGDCRQQLFNQLDTIAVNAGLLVDQAPDNQNYVVLKLGRHGNRYGGKFSKITKFTTLQPDDGIFSFEKMKTKINNDVGPINPVKRDQVVIYVRECGTKNLCCLQLIIVKEPKLMNMRGPIVNVVDPQHRIPSHTGHHLCLADRLLKPFETIDTPQLDFHCQPACPQPASLSRRSRTRSPTLVCVFVLAELYYLTAILGLKSYGPYSPKAKYPTAHSGE